MRKDIRSVTLSKKLDLSDVALFGAILHGRFYASPLSTLHRSNPLATTGDTACQIKNPRTTGDAVMQGFKARGQYRFARHSDCIWSPNRFPRRNGHLTLTTHASIVNTEIMAIRHHQPIRFPEDRRFRKLLLRLKSRVRIH